MRTAFRALLAGTPAITDIVPPEQINFGTHPQGVGFPAIVINVIDLADGLTMKGPDGLWRGRFQVDCYSDDYGTVEALSRAVVTAISGYRGDGFQGIFLDSQRDHHETGAATQPLRISIDFITHWRDK